MDQIEKSRALYRRRVELVTSLVAVALGGACVLIVSWGPRVAANPHALVAPMLAMGFLTFAVLASVPFIRHWAVLTRRASLAYFADLKTDPPAEWIERPARTFNNLMQAPTLFYVISFLMIITPWADEAQIALAWLFVALRAAHALIYILVNRVSLRFAAFAVSILALFALWIRFALYAPVL